MPNAVLAEYRSKVRKPDDFDAFWEGVQRQFVLYRQPRSVLQDGATTRSLTRELLLTAWDAVPVAYAVDDGGVIRASITAK